MKKIFSLFFLLLLLFSWVSAETIPKYIKLASWNIRIFSNSRTDDQLRAICKIAKDFDFFAVVELRDELVLKRMINMLNSEFGKSYSYLVSPFVGNTREEMLYLTKEDIMEEERGSRELYAFVYDNRFITPIDSGKIFEDSAFLRCPYYASFRAGNFDFTTIVTHIIWGDTVDQRRKEIQRLAYVFETIHASNPKENDIILLGDFNREPDDDLAWGPLRAKPYMTNLFNLPEKSMIWDSNLYDNIWFQSCYVTECTLDKGIIRFDETDFGNNDPEASQAVSDHRPIWAIFRTDGVDDD